MTWPISGTLGRMDRGDGWMKVLGSWRSPREDCLEWSSVLLNTRWSWHQAKPSTARTSPATLWVTRWHTSVLHELPTYQKGALEGTIAHSLELVHFLGLQLATKCYLFSCGFYGALQTLRNHYISLVMLNNVIRSVIFNLLLCQIKS